MKENYDIVHISDIHFKAVPSKTALEQLTNQFLSYIEKMENVDLIIIAGDLFHSKIMVNSLHFKAFILFITKLFKIAKEKDSKIRIIKGTESHDFRQLEYIDPLLAKYDVDCRIYHTVASEYVFENMRVLFIPEEYVENTEGYYKDYFNEVYDLVVLHGLVTETAFNASKQESETTHKKAPVLPSKKLMEICKGPILAGHIHTKTVIKDAIFYSGSFFRWIYGEEDPKGFFTYSYNVTTGEYRYKFIENKEADKYITYAYSFKEVKDTDINFIDDISKQFDELKKNGNHYRLIFNIGEEYTKADLLIKVINEFLLKKENLKIVIKNNQKLKKKVERDDKLKRVYLKYKKVLDKNAPIEEQIHYFIKEKYGVDITIERIKDYLEKPISIECEG